MNELTLNDLIQRIKEYNPDAIPLVKKAYEYADLLHQGQFRQSGEPYITHPLNVAYILAELHADQDTLCAGLLHDTLEDTKATKEDIAHDFNPEIADLVDGVTKISNMDYSKTELNNANTRKIIMSVMDDVRIIIIKLADRLHNMRTLEFKSEFKQKENSIETLNIFVPFAYYIGAYRIKSELEDISLRYLNPEKYKEIEDVKNKTEIESEHCLKQMLQDIKGLLEFENIPNEIKIRTKNIYGIYKRLEEGHKITDIHDLLSLKIMVDKIKNCYIALGMIHSQYHPINNKFKDYIYNPKTNMYRSLHTTVFGPDERLIQTQIRTFDMDKVASFGLTAYWEIRKGQARGEMQKELSEKFQFYKSLKQIDTMFVDNEAFVNQVKEELFNDKIYVYTPRGDIKELPKGSTVIDFAYSIHTAIGNSMIGAIVNNEEVPMDYQLKNKDRVKVLTDELSATSKEEWINTVKTTKARRKIKEYVKR